MDKAQRAAALMNLPQAAQDAIGKGDPGSALDIVVQNGMKPPQWLLDEAAVALMATLPNGWDVETEMHLGQVRMTVRKVGKVVAPWDDR